VLVGGTWGGIPLCEVGLSYQMVEYFISNDADHFEGCFGADRINEHVAMNANEVLRLHNTVFVLNNVS
jgi:hypothetical protein